MNAFHIDTSIDEAAVEQLGPVSRRVVELFDCSNEWPLPGNSSVAGLLHISESHLRRLLAGESTTMGTLRARYYTATAVGCLRRARLSVRFLPDWAIPNLARSVALFGGGRDYPRVRFVSERIVYPAGSDLPMNPCSSCTAELL